MRSILIFLVIFFWSNLIFAATIYMQNSGNKVTYSDTPIYNAKKIEVPSGTPTSPENTVTTQNVPVSTTTPTTTMVEVKTYKIFEIMSPKDQQTFQNERDIPVEVNIEPKLAEGDKVGLFLDGIAYGKTQENINNLKFTQLERGIHQIYAVLYDKNNNIILKTKPLTIYIHFASAVFPPPRTGG